MGKSKLKRKITVVLQQKHGVLLSYVFAASKKENFFL